MMSAIEAVKSPEGIAAYQAETAEIVEAMRKREKEVESQRACFEKMQQAIRALKLCMEEFLKDDNARPLKPSGA
jgi:L-serine deaminase